MSEDARPVVILGAGLTGLSLAVALKRAGRPVRVLETSLRPGGVIRSMRREGFLVEESANSMMIKAPEVERFIRDSGLEKALVDANPVARKRFLMRNGNVLPMPMSVTDGIRTPLYTPGAKLRLLKEPFVPAPPADRDESVASFVTRRMGREFLDYGIAALVSGIFAGDPERLSMRHAFPKVWNLEARYGSLIGGAVKLMRERKREGIAPYKSRIVSFRDGLQTLTDTLAEELGDRLVLGSECRSISPAEGGWRISYTDADGAREVTGSRLVATVPLAALVALPWPEDIAGTVAGIPLPYHPAVTTLSLGYRKSQVSHAVDGFGLLAPLVEGRSILGAIFSSTLFPGRAPRGHVLFMVFMGGATRPELARDDPGEAVEIAEGELADMFGITGEPVFHHHTYWPRAIPQYNLGHGDFLAALESVESRWPGLHIAGNFRGGPGCGDCIASALALAQKLRA
ncbi:MAG: protoporphyrinogen oxidase [Gammaproteobacteria bacterium]